MRWVSQRGAKKEAAEVGLNVCSKGGWGSSTRNARSTVFDTKSSKDAASSRESSSACAAILEEPATLTPTSRLPPFLIPQLSTEGLPLLPLLGRSPSRQAANFLVRFINQQILAPEHRPGNLSILWGVTVFTAGIIAARKFGDLITPVF